jgi:alpha-glucoside transport system substrate-binding protein
MHHAHRRTALAGTALATMALTFSSIGVAAQDASPAASMGADEMMSTGYPELDMAMGSDQPLAGSKVTMQTQWVGGEAPNFQAALQPFIDATGIQVSVASVPAGQHETLVNVSLNGGAAADIIQLAQPSAINAYGDQGLILDVNTLLDGEKLAAEHPATVPLYTTEGGTWGLPYKVDVKSVVWYPIKAFEAAGYEVPTTWDELIALSDQIVADGNGSPWCVAIEASNATGWITTDLIEDIMLRTTDVATYDAWANHTLPFESPEVKNAFDLAGQIYFTPGYVAGGDTAILATPLIDAMDPMFNDDLQNPLCWMHKQATWYGPDFFPDAKAGDGTSKYVIGEDIGLFYFPEIDPAYGKAALGSGDAFMVTQDRPEVRALAQYFASPEGIKAWIDLGSAISANQTTPADWYADSYKLQVASDIVANASQFGFDASDLMPASGAGFWAGIIDWVSGGGQNTDAVLQAIDANWQS